ncbi:MAG: hypothetical protein C0626_13060 [Arcobacter sp.]|uniref:sensor domain-containing diguanylate cyclase n=1 Tax=uncultured Arcobacter sp. TaxID=165434 RepID=UPI000CA90148|nr:diguanylate cyclase [uncultured Arcobacter sp.]PLY08768.1 MAG: hypothetical protein C0626_13060 [Arcobacter sp.]
MKISKKMALLFTLISLIIITFISGLVQNRIQKSQILEDKIIQRNILKLHNIIDFNSEYLKKIAYEFQENERLRDIINKSDHAQLKTYFSDSNLMEELNISNFLIFDKDKKFLFGKSYDISSNEMLSVSTELINFIKTKDIKKYINKKKEIFYMTTDYEKSIFDIKEIKNRNTQTIGYIYFSRAIDSHFLSNISDVLQEYVSLINSVDFDKFNTIKNKKLNIKYKTVNVDENYLFTYVRYFDEFENKNFYFSIKSKRYIYQELKSNMNFILYCVSICFLLIIMIFYIFIKIFFSDRIIKISNKVKKISENNNLEIIIKDNYDDEISFLAKKLNEMLLSIDIKQHEKLKKERDFLKSVLDTQQNIIMITQGDKIQSVNKKFVDTFTSEDNFLSNIVLVDNNTQKNLLNIAQYYSSKNIPAKFQIMGDDNFYFTFDVSKLDMGKYLICMNDVSTLNKKISHLEVKASIDGLTKIFNKVAIKDMCEVWIDTKEFHLLVLDIDFFKKINDTYGHLCGDYILKDAINNIRKIISKKDYIGRIGGEEFMILLDEKNKENAINIAQRIRQNIENTIFDYGNNLLKITISIGVAKNILNKDTYETIYERADKALYKAKDEGRNRVIYEKEE